MEFRRFPIRIGVGLLFAALLLPNRAVATEIKVLCPVALNVAMKELGDAFTAQSGITVVFTFGKVQEIETRVSAGIPADVVVLPSAQLRTLVAKGALNAGSDYVLGRVALGVAARAGAPHVDISTPERFRAALLQARAVAYTDPATGSGGGILAGLLLQRADYAGVHAMPVMGPASAAVTRGDAALALQPMSELAHITDITIMGPVPPQLGVSMDFSAGVLATSTVRVEAQSFLNFVTEFAESEVWKRNGVER
jgi:molybdate transport system substrate-binding protein